MRKLVLSVILLSILALTAVPMIRTARAPSIPNLKYTATPIREQFIEEATFGEPLPLPTGYYLGYDIDLVNAEYFANGGQGIYVAIIDTGLVSNWYNFLPSTAVVRTDLAKGWSYDVSWNGVDYDWTPNPNRGYITGTHGSGHGTHVASTIVGYYRSTIGVAPHIVTGVAPKATIIPLLGLDTWWLDCPDPNYPGYHDGKVLFRGGDDWMLTEAIYYVAELAEQNGWKIICNNSWGSSEPSPAIREAIDYAITKGVIFVFSAGNEGTAQMGWPGAYPEVISAAAGGWTMQYIGTGSPNIGGRWYLTDVPENLNTRNNPIEIAYGIPNNYYDNNWEIYLGDFSGRPNAALGQSWKDLDVCAPGCAVVGPYKPEVAWDDTYGWVNVAAGTAYYGLWGTSMAAPHVVGVAAIVAQQHPTLDQFQMEYVLKKAASRIPLPSATMWAVDPFYGPAFPKNDHDGGAGWLTADLAVKVAASKIID